MRKVLILFDTVSGATARAAEELAARLRELGASAYAVPLAQAKRPVPCDLLVLGSPLRFGRPTSRLRRFVSENRSALGHQKIALFFTCLTLRTMEGAERETLPLFTDPALTRPVPAGSFQDLVLFTHTLPFAAKNVRAMLDGLSPHAVGFLRGGLSLARLSAVDRLLALFLMIFIEEMDEGDFLDQESVSAFAETLLA